jgi:hypothetical protein
MIHFRKILTGAAALVLVAGFAKADLLVGYTITTSPTNTDILDNTALLTAWDPGGSSSTDSVVSNVSGTGYMTGVTMASLNAASGFTYTLVGYNITDKSFLTGNYTITNNAPADGGTPATGSAFIDSTTAVTLAGPLAPPLNNTSDPANDLFREAKTGVGTGGAQGEQVTSISGGPDPNAPAQSGLNIAPGGGTFTSPTINVNSGFVDLGCELSNLVANGGGGAQFCTDGSITAAKNDLITATTVGYTLGLVTKTTPLTFDFSTATQTDTSLTGGSTQTTYNTQVAEQFTVVYDYTETAIPPTGGVPEPATLALFSGALLAIGLYRKKAVR